jgi:tetratricopeptide (TPR) repeat protein
MLKTILAVSLSLIFANSAFAERILATQPETMEIDRMLEVGQLEAAYDKAKAYAQSHDSSAEAHYWLGSAAGSMAGSVNFFSAASYAKQIKVEFEKAAQLDPTLIEARMGLIQFHLQAPGIVGGDEDQIPVLLAQISALDKGAGLRATAGVRLGEKDNAGAEALYRQALSLDAADADALAAMVGLMCKDKRFAPAAELLKAALAKAPDAPKIRYQSGKFSALSGTDLVAGLANLDALIASKPMPKAVSQAGLHYRRGQILALLNRKPEAITALERALQIDPMKEVKAELARLRKG